MRFSNSSGYDNGSRDCTLQVLNEIAASSHGNVTVHALPKNQGKAEAVRVGLLAAIQDAAELVGFTDADLSVPPQEILRVLELTKTVPNQVVMGSRVQLLGSDIQRSTIRHVFGRIFALAASQALRLPVYDTQCGLKFLRVSSSLHAALARPFVTGWAFDVELMGRLLTGSSTTPALVREDFLEVPLQTWRDVEGSKVTPFAAVRAGVSLLLVAAHVRLGPATTRPVEIQDLSGSTLHNSARHK